MPPGLERRNLGQLEVSALSGVHQHLALLPVASEAPACDVRTLSCPPLSIHLHRSHPTPFLCHQPQPALLPPSINLSPPSVSSPLSACLFHPLISSSPSEALLSLLLPSFFPPLYNFAPCVSIPLVLCHSRSVPHFFLPSFSLPRPYLSSASLPY